MITNGDVRIARTSAGSAPTGNSGGTNPGQIGMGAVMSGTQRNFNNGSITATGVPTDVAIEGAGMFITQFGGEQLFTRSGSFQRNEANDLVTIGGARIMGYGVDSNFQVVQGNLVPLNIPVGTLTLAEATRNATFNGNLNASGDGATDLVWGETVADVGRRGEPRLTTRTTMRSWLSIWNLLGGLVMSPRGRSAQEDTETTPTADS